ncbi:MAG: DNA-binding protein [Allopontixanthobacter sediminis]
MDQLELVRVRVLPGGRLDRANAARLLGKTPKTLAEWHRRGVGPRSFLVGGRRFYLLDELSLYANGKTHLTAAGD